MSGLSERSDVEWMPLSLAGRAGLAAGSEAPDGGNQRVARQIPDSCRSADQPDRVLGISGEGRGRVQGRNPRGLVVGDHSRHQRPGRQGAHPECHRRHVGDPGDVLAEGRGHVVRARDAYSADPGIRATTDGAGPVVKLHAVVTNGLPARSLIAVAVPTSRAVYLVSAARFAFGFRVATLVVAL